MKELRYVATPHLSGCCVTVENQVHGLFVVKRARGPADSEAKKAVREIAVLRQAEQCGAPQTYRAEPPKRAA